MLSVMISRRWKNMYKNQSLTRQRFVGASLNARLSADVKRAELRHLPLGLRFTARGACPSSPWTGAPSPGRKASFE